MLNNKNVINKYIIAIILIFVIFTAVLSLIPDYLYKLYIISKIEAAEQNRDILFIETIDGTMLYVPVSQKEAIAEATGVDGTKGLYLFTQTNNTVTISDDIMITYQSNLYTILKSIVEEGQTDLKNDAYIAKIKGTSNIINIVANKWKLSEGQTMGALSLYEIDKTDNAQLELVLSEKSKGNFDFAVNLYVNDKAYTVYRGVALANSLNLPFPPELYKYNKYAGLKTDDEKVQEYLKYVIDYFYTVSQSLKLPNKLTIKKEE